VPPLLTMARQAPQLPSALGSSYAIQDADYTWHDGETPSARRGAVQVAVVCTPHSGHMLPVLHIAAELTRSGHRVTVYTADYAVRDFEKKVRQAGAAIHGLDMGGLTEEAAQQRAKAGKRIIFLVIKEAMTKPLREALQADRPSVVVSDFATWAGMEVAEELGIPLVINFPGPLALARDVLGLPSPSTAWSFCGFHFARNSLSPFSMALFANINQMGNFTRILRKHMAAGALVLVQTIWDLDAPQPLYPNIVVTGPVLPAATDLRQRLAKDHGELYRFLQAAGPEGVVYVSTGSLAELHKWQVEALYHGLKKTGARTVWSLKEKQQAFLPVRDDPDFYISKWTPQAELMQDSAVRCVITHCGWGGTLECMTAGKPVVCIPFFGDQPTNARLLQRAGAGELIGKIPNGTEGSQNPYKEGDFTPDTVAAAVGKVVGSPSYRDAVARMTRASRACGGAGMAVQQIEWAAWYGTGHLRSEAFLAVSGTSLWSAAALGAAGLAAAVGLLACAYARTLRR